MKKNDIIEVAINDLDFPNIGTTNFENKNKNKNTCRTKVRLRLYVHEKKVQMQD